MCVYKSIYFRCVEIYIHNSWHSFEDMLLMNCIKWLSRTSPFISSTTSINYKTFLFLIRTHTLTHPSSLRLRKCALSWFGLAFANENSMHVKHIIWLFVAHTNSFICGVCAFFCKRKKKKNLCLHFRGNAKNFTIRINERFCYWRHSNYCFSTFI